MYPKPNDPTDYTLKEAIDIVVKAGGKVREDGTGLSFDAIPPDQAIPAIQIIANHMNDKK